MKTLAWCYIVFGFLWTVNALIAGPHAFGAGWIAVIALSLSGLLAVLIGVYVINRVNR